MMQPVVTIKCLGEEKTRCNLPGNDDNLSKNVTNLKGQCTQNNQIGQLTEESSSRPLSYRNTIKNTSAQAKTVFQLVLMTVCRDDKSKSTFF
jgi:hypothetical protein